MCGVDDVLTAPNHREEGLSPHVRGRCVQYQLMEIPDLVYPRMCGVDSLVFNVLNAIQGLFMQISYLFYRGIVLGF